MCITVIITYAESSHRIKHIFDMQCNKLRLKLKKNKLCFTSYSYSTS